MQQQNSAGGIVARIGRRIRRTVEGAPAANEHASESTATSQTGDGNIKTGSIEHLRSIRDQITQAEADLQTADQERERLKAERLRLQELLGQQHNKRVLPRLKVEKTNGLASLVVGARMMQRIHAKAEDPSAGIDGVGAVFADVARTQAYARSYGVDYPVLANTEPSIVAHAFIGQVPLLEVRAGGRTKHLTPDRGDPGDIRPGADYDPEIAIPDHVDALIAASRTLSAHLPRPYVQIGWILRDGELALTGVEVNPGRIPVFDAEWDERLGKAFDAAHARMLMQPYRAGALDNRSRDGIFRYEESV